MGRWNIRKGSGTTGSVPHGVDYIASGHGGARLLPVSIRKKPIKWDKDALRSAGLLPISQDWYDILDAAGVPMVAGVHFSDRDLSMPDGAGGSQSGWWAEAWVFLALHTWGKRSRQGWTSWIKELMECEKLRVVIVTEALMMCKTRTSWRGPAQIWLDQQRTCARTCPYL